MTQTVQSCSYVLLSEVEKDLTKHKHQGEDRMSLHSYNSLKKTKEFISKMEGALQRQLMDLNNLGYTAKNIEINLTKHKHQKEDRMSLHSYNSLKKTKELISKMEDAIQKQIMDLNNLGYTAKILEQTLDRKNRGENK